MPLWVGFPAMAWWGIVVRKEDWSMWLSGAKLQRKKTARGAV